MNREAVREAAAMEGRAPLNPVEAHVAAAAWSLVLAAEKAAWADLGLVRCEVIAIAHGVPQLSGALIWLANGRA
jgi:hypothetical protein